MPHGLGARTATSMTATEKNWPVAGGSVSPKFWPSSIRLEDLGAQLDITGPHLNRKS